MWKYAHVINYAITQPWATTDAIRAVIFDTLVFRARGGRMTPDEIRARIGDDQLERPSAADARVVRPTGGTGAAVAVVPVYGVLVHRPMQASSGMMSAEGIGRSLASAVNDPEVGAIVLDISSPGGAVEGIPELAAKIADARKQKRVVAVANAMAASAAYWLGSQADTFVVTPSGSVGSIGVYSLHEDWSKWLEREGVSITAIQAGARKLEGAPWAPLDTEAREHFQAGVDEAYKQFTLAVARGRNVSVEVARGEQFGEGRMFEAKDAKARGLVDDIATLDDTIARLAKELRAAPAAGSRADALRMASRAEHEAMEMAAAASAE